MRATVLADVPALVDRYVAAIDVAKDGTTASRREWHGARGVGGRAGAIRSLMPPNDTDPRVEVEPADVAHRIISVGQGFPGERVFAIDLAAGQTVAAARLFTTKRGAFVVKPPAEEQDRGEWSTAGITLRVLAEQAVVRLTMDCPPPLEWGAVYQFGPRFTAATAKPLNDAAPCAAWKLEASGSSATLTIDKPLPGYLYVLRWLPAPEA